ncbi:hypothetical protein TURU_007913 [Turdus rufiventris]|nr:hypothetical protein TURU_007913 [Turdus rufiventris]
MPLSLNCRHLNRDTISQVIHDCEMCTVNKQTKQFVNWLCAQVERQVEDLVEQAALIKEMAQWNANEACCRVILGLPIDPPPTLAQAIEACAKKAELFSTQERKLGLAKPKTAAAVTPGVKRQPMSPEQLKHVICFQCQKPGHFARDCPQSQQKKKKNQKEGTTKTKKTRTRARTHL